MYYIYLFILFLDFCRHKYTHKQESYESYYFLVFVFYKMKIIIFDVQASKIKHWSKKVEKKTEKKKCGKLFYLIVFDKNGEIFFGRALRCVIVAVVQV